MHLFLEKFKKKVYDDFYYRLISDPYFAEFFRNKNSEDIKSKQIENLIRNYNKFIKGNLEEVKQNYIQLAKLHDELGLDFNSYMDSLSDLEIFILKEFFHFYKQNQLFFLYNCYKYFLKMILFYLGINPK